MAARAADPLDDRGFRALLDAVPAALLVVDEAGEIAALSAQAEILFGYARAELSGHSVDDVIGNRVKGDRPGFQARCRSWEEQHDGGVVIVDLCGRRKDGQEFPANVELGHLELKGRALILATISDSTADEQRAKLNQAQEAIRMRDEFLSIASHELKTPLTALQLHTESIIRTLSRSTDVEAIALVVRKAGAIRGAAEKLTKLINQLLDLSRITAGRLTLEIERVDLVAVVERVIAQFDGLAKQHGCEVQFDVKSAAAVGSWDLLRIEQIVVNLLSNAIKYGNGRPVVISVRASGSGFAIIEVRDHGIGIPLENQGRIFERFERLVPHRDYGGFGLGLWIVNQMVQAHRGSIRVWSQPGVGSTFTVELPMTEVKLGSAPEPAVVIGSQCVMLVEDDAMMRSSFEDALSDEGFDIITAANGWEALRLLRTGIHPRLLFLDLIMPTMDGKTFIEQKSQDARLAGIPVVLLSAANELEERASALGAVTFLKKPVNLAAVIDAVERYGRKAGGEPAEPGRPAAAPELRR